MSASTVRSKVWATGVTLALLMPVFRAEAQVNVEPFRKKLKEQGRTLHVRGAVSAYQGNSNGLLLSAGSLVGLSSLRQLAYVAASGDYARSEHTASVAKLFAHARYGYGIAPHWIIETFAQWEHDRFRRISSRTLLGVGPRIEWQPGDSVSFALGSSYMLELTNRNGTGATADRSEAYHRSNNYATVTYKAHANVALSETVYFQPRFDRPSDYFLLSVFGARFTVTETLSSGVDLRLRRESVVPAGVVSTDTEVSSNLSVTF